MEPYLSDLHVAKCNCVVLSNVTVTVLATGLKVHRYKHGRGLWIFEGDKNPQNDFLPRGSKAVSMLKNPRDTKRDTCRQNS
jgi:hypothetical protein